MNLASSKSQWPVGRGFERFYGFLGAETNQWYPDLVYDNHPVEQPSLARGGLPPHDRHHRQGDRRSSATPRRSRPTSRSSSTTAPGACHAPHHAPKEWVDKYKGKFDMGYEAYRELVFERQKQLGILPDSAELSPINPYADETSADGKDWPELDTVRPVGLAVRRREAAVLPDGGGLRGLPEPRRPRDRAAARLPRGERRARQHADRAGLRQRRLGRGRPERLGQREQVLQRHARPHRGQPAVPRRPRQAPRPTTTTRPAGRGRSTRRSRCGSATPTTRAAPPIR